MDAADPATVAIERFVDLAAQVRALPASCGPVRLVAIDGPGGAGKSTFAARLASALGGVPVVHTDDFASWDDEFSWYPRLRAQLIEPLASGRPGRFQRYDWATRELAEWHDVPLGPVLVLEGVGAARREITDELALAVWIETPPDLRLARGIERDGEELRDFWLHWIEGERRHFAADRTRERAELVVLGGCGVPHDRDTEYGRLRG